MSRWSVLHTCKAINIADGRKEMLEQVLKFNSNLQLMGISLNPPDKDSLKVWKNKSGEVYAEYRLTNSIPEKYEDADAFFYPALMHFWHN